MGERASGGVGDSHEVAKQNSPGLKAFGPGLSCYAASWQSSIRPVAHSPIRRFALSRIPFRPIAPLPARCGTIGLNSK
jgi:hypothetical protein